MLAGCGSAAVELDGEAGPVPELHVVRPPGRDDGAVARGQLDDLAGAVLEHQAHRAGVDDLAAAHRRVVDAFVDSLDLRELGFEQFGVGEFERDLQRLAPDTL